jgi:hypothetical protein
MFVIILHVIDRYLCNIFNFSYGANINEFIERYLNVSLNLRAKKPWLNRLMQAASIRSVNTSAYCNM